MCNTFRLQETNPLKHVTKSTYDERFGAVLQKSDVNNLVTRFTYDDLGRLVKTCFPDGSCESVGLDWCTGNCPDLAVYSTSNVDVCGVQSTIFYDVLERSIRVQGFGMDGISQIFSDTKYNSNGQVYMQSEPYWASDGEAVWTSHQYDVLLRETKTTFADNTTTTHKFEGLKTTIRNQIGQTNQG